MSFHSKNSPVNPFMPQMFCLALESICIHAIIYIYIYIYIDIDMYRYIDIFKLYIIYHIYISYIYIYV